MRSRKVVAVTGAGSGIGREIALQAARKGYAVLAVSKNTTHAQSVADEIANDGGTCVSIAADVTQADAPSRIVTAAQIRFGALHVVINNAGFATAGALLEQNDGAIDAQWEVHVAAPLRIARAALPMLRESHGQLMFVGSGLARVPAPFYGAYCAAKAAVRAAATQLRRELHGSGIAVTYVDPGSVRTEFAQTAGIPPYGPRWASVEAPRVAGSIVRAIETRPAVVNAVPMHTFFAALGEWFPRASDRALASRVANPPENRAPIPTPAPQPQPAPSPQPELQAQPNEFEAALQPVARRLERVKLSREFLAELLRTGEDVQLGDAAMRWAGMPNKNERAAMSEALEALTQGGFLQKTGEETWRVVRTPS